MGLCLLCFFLVFDEKDGNEWGGGWLRFNRMRLAAGWRRVRRVRAGRPSGSRRGATTSPAGPSRRVCAAAIGAAPTAPTPPATAATCRTRPSSRTCTRSNHPKIGQRKQKTNKKNRHTSVRYQRYNNTRSNNANQVLPNFMVFH